MQCGMSKKTEEISLVRDLASALEPFFAGLRPDILTIPDAEESLEAFYSLFAGLPEYEEWKAALKTWKRAVEVLEQYRE